MAGFIRRFTAFPPLDVITAIEGVNIVDLIPPGIFVGVQTGTVCLVGEWPKGTFNSPTLVEGDQTITQTFGGFSLSVTDPLSFATNPFSNGNAFVWLKNKVFRRLVLVRVDMDLAEGVHIQLTGTPSPLTEDVTIPAGTRVRSSGAPTEEFALSDDIVFAAGTDLTVVANTPYDPDTPSYSTRTVADVPVYSTQGNDESLVGDVDEVDSTDLFRAGIGAGTSLPSIVVTVATGALDGAAANAAVLTALTSGAIDTAYQNALDSTLPGGGDAVDLIQTIAAARQSTAIRTALAGNAADSSAVGTGRHAVTRAPIGTLPAAAIGAADPGVGANRSDRNFYCYPHFEQSIPEIASLDPQAVISAPEILLGADAAMATILSNLPPEENPGQSTTEFRTGGLLTFVRKLEDGLTGAGLPTAFTLTNYQSFLAAGVAALRRDTRISEWIFQSGVTSIDPTLFPQLAPIKRRRMADFIQDSAATISLVHNKKLQTAERFDAFLGGLTDFLDTLLSENNPAQQRIADYSIDGTSGNSEALQGSGVSVVIIDVTTLDDFRHIVLQTTIGETVVIEEVF